VADYRERRKTGITTVSGQVDQLRTDLTNKVDIFKTEVNGKLDSINRQVNSTLVHTEMSSYLFYDGCLVGLPLLFVEERYRNRVRRFLQLFPDETSDYNFELTPSPQKRCHVI